MGAHFEGLDEGVLPVPLDPRYTQVGFKLVSVQVCWPLAIKVLVLLEFDESWSKVFDTEYKNKKAMINAFDEL